MAVPFAERRARDCIQPRRASLKRLAMTLLTGWAGATLPAMLRASPESDLIRRIESIALLPVVYPGPLRDPKITHHVFEVLTLTLAAKGHVLERASGFAAGTAVDVERLKQARDDELVALMPTDADYLLLCWVEEISSEQSFVKDSASISLSAVLIDRRGQRILWRSRARDADTLYVVTWGSGWFYKMLVDTQLVVISGGFRRLLAGFPEKPMR